MAISNTLLQPGTSAFKPQAPITFGQNPTLNTFNAARTPAPLSANSFASSTQSTTPQSIPGLLNPHAPVGQVSSAPVQSHTVTTDGQGSTTSKVTYHPSVQQPDGSWTLSAPPSDNSQSAPSTPSPTQIPPITQNQPNTGTPQPTPTPPVTNQQPFAQGLLGIGTQGSQGYNDAVAHLAALKTSLAQKEGGIETAGTDLNFQVGQEAVLNRVAAAEIQAAQEAVQQQQTQQGQQTTALTAGGGLMTPGQTNVTASPGSVTTNTLTGQQYSAPTLGQYGQAQYSPNGQPVGTGGGQVSPNDPFYGTMQTYAKLLANNQGGAIPSSITGNPVLQAQLQTMAKAINPNYNYNTAQGTGAAQQSNAQVGGTAGVTANQAALNPAYAAYLQLQQTTQNIDQFSGLLTQTMQQGGINPSDVKYANTKIADIRSQLSSPQQAVYDNTLASLRSRVSGLLAAGGSEIPTQITADANKILDGSLPLSSLNAVLTRIQAEGNILLTNQANLVNTAYSGATGGNTNSNANTNPSPWQ